MGRPVVHFEVTGSDSAALQRFYAELFGWTIQPIPEMGYALVDRAETGTIGGGLGQSDDPNARGVTFYVEVGDLQAALDRAEQLGGRTLVPMTEIPNMVTFALFADPQGNRIGLVKGDAQTEA